MTFEPNQSRKCARDTVDSAVLLNKDSHRVLLDMLHEKFRTQELSIVILASIDENDANYVSLLVVDREWSIQGLYFT